MELVLAVVVVGIVIYLWRERRDKLRKSVPTDVIDEPPFRQPAGSPPNWDDVWCNSVASGMDPKGEAAAQLLAMIQKQQPGWEPPTCA